MCPAITQIEVKNVLRETLKFLGEEKERHYLGF